MNEIEHSESFWEVLPAREDRLKNELNGVTQLRLTLSNRDHPMNRSAPAYFRTAYGNINGDGNPISFASPIMGLQNAHLSAGLEPWIAPLVSLLIGMRCVTYSSCEGHLIRGDFYEAYVGMLFDEDRRSEISALTQLAHDAGFMAFRTWLIDSIDGTRHKTVEMYFPRLRHSTLADYHRALDAATKKLARSLPHAERRESVLSSPNMASDATPL